MDLTWSEAFIIAFVATCATILTLVWIVLHYSKKAMKKLTTPVMRRKRPVKHRTK